MINEFALREGLKKLLKQTEEDIRQHLLDEPELEARLKEQHAGAVAAGRSASGGYLGFRDESVTQAAVHWLLGCVFVRFVEDNLLIDEAWMAGSGERLQQALDRRQLFYRENPRANDTDYLIRIFETVATLPDMAGLFDREHNPIWRLRPTGSQAMNILKFFQQRDENTGRLQYDFSDPDWGTRFLGDLYQNLSEYAQKRYALCQTPDFVVRFILDRTLTPAIDVFGLEGIRLIDPTCGSGHFLLAAFEILYAKWLIREPSANPTSLVQRALSSIYGIDLNPFAVAITRFRLLIQSLRASQIRKLRDAPTFSYHIASGDALLHGPLLGRERATQRLLENDPGNHFFVTEDSNQLRQHLSAQYNVVVGNPPYINVSDPILRSTYRSRYPSCHGKYQLSVPFLEKFFNLALEGSPLYQQPPGFIGVLISSAFAKKAFGAPIVEQFLTSKDLTHVIDTSGVYLPGHGTSTFIMFARNGRPQSQTIRAVRGIQGEKGTPSDPANAPVWSAINRQIDVVDSQSVWVSVADAPRKVFDSHPWAMGGGGAAELREDLESGCDRTLNALASSVGITSFTLADDIYNLQLDAATRMGIRDHLRINVYGESLRDWACVDDGARVVFPYDEDLEVIDIREDQALHKYLWPGRTTLANGIMFGSKTKVDAGLKWYEYGRLTAHKLRGAFSIAFTNMETQNHYVLIRDTYRRLFNPHAPLIKLRKEEDEKLHIDLLGLLNSSTALFWLKQVCLPRGGDQVGKDGARVRKFMWDVYYEFDGTKLKNFPLPEYFPSLLAEQMLQTVDHRTSLLPDRLCAARVPNQEALEAARAESDYHFSRMIAIQEELDWQVYHLYGLLDDDNSLPVDQVPRLRLGQRPFEILMARQMEAGELETTWFERHGSTPITQIPTDWPEHYRKAVEKRIQIIETNRDIALIEQPEYKRRWNLPGWDELQQKALENWLLDRMEQESLWQEPELVTCARLADRLRRDLDFVQVAEVYSAHGDLTELVTKLALKQAVPFLPVLRYKASGLEKRREWENVWDLQRKEDAGQKVEIPVPPKYKAPDFLEATFWNLRGGLDVPKERFIVYPHLQRDADATPVLAWAGWDHLKQAKALAAYYQHVREEEGWGADRLKPVLAGLLELIPWLKQWHNEEDLATGERMGDTFEAFVEAECREFGFTVERVSAWTPQATSRRGRRRT